MSRPTGRKVWRVEYRPSSRRARGGDPAHGARLATNQLTPDQAQGGRRQKFALNGPPQRGNDPAKERGEKRREMKMAALSRPTTRQRAAMSFAECGRAEPMKPKTKAYTVARLRNHVVPLLGNRRVTEITSGDVERMVRISPPARPQETRSRGRDGASSCEEETAPLARWLATSQQCSPQFVAQAANDQSLRNCSYSEDRQPPHPLSQP